MEHYRSVFATAAIMVFGLVAASPLVREQHSGSPKAHRVATDTVSSGGDAWIDPPRQKMVSVPATAAAMSSHDGVGVAPVARPASFTLLPSETAALLAAGDFAKTDAVQRVQAVRRHRAAKVAARTRLATVVASPAAGTPAPVQETSEAKPQKAAGIDPIGDILRGLGIGRDS